MALRNPYDEDEDYEDELDVSELVDEVMDHPRVRRTLSLFTETLDRFGQLIDQVSRRVPGGVPPRPDWNSVHRTTGPRAAPPDPRKAINPYLVLGFQPGQRLTAEMIKERRRKLAGLYHPDQGGGDPEAMKMTNAAADMLLKKIGAK